MKLHPRGLINMFKVFLIKHLESHFFSSAKRLEQPRTADHAQNLNKQTKRKTNIKAGFPVKESLKTCHKPFLLVYDKFPVSME